jgi:hypothetical protein
VIGIVVNTSKGLDMSVHTHKQWICVVLASLTTLGLASCAAEDPPETGDSPETAEHDSALNLTGNWIYDSGTQCSAGGATMHCCPSGYVMIGAHIDRNVFKCGQVTGFASPTVFLDVATQRNGMHACPWPTVMVGLHESANWLACRQLATPPVFEFVDTGTQDGFPMHVCQTGSAMAGIRIDQNRFTCDF